jgi:valyl-tRNA synthetase
MPFVSEELWQALRPYISEQALAPHLAVARFPVSGLPGHIDAHDNVMTHCLEATEAINILRSVLGYHPGQRVQAFIRPAAPSGDTGRILADSEFEVWRHYAMTLAKAETLTLVDESQAAPVGVVTTVLPWCSVSVKAPENFDFEKARGVVGKKLGEVNTHYEQHARRLNNPDFIAKAALEMQEQIQERAAELLGQRKALEEQLRLLQGAG